MRCSGGVGGRGSALQWRAVGYGPGACAQRGPGRARAAPARAQERGYRKYVLSENRISYAVNSGVAIRQIRQSGP